MFNKSIVPLVVVFLISAALILIFRNQLAQQGFNWHVLSGGNLFLYVVTMISMHLLREGMSAANTQGFLIRTYGAITIKLFACAIAAFVYIFLTRKNLNKPALFACMGLYLVYTYVELRTIMKYNLKKNV